MRLASAVLLVALLNLAILPCVVAAPAPPAQETVHSQHEHRADTDVHHGHATCPHCAVFDRGDCSDEGGCSGPDWLKPDGANLFEDNAGSYFALIPAVEFRRARLTEPSLTNCYGLGVPPPIGPPLTLRYCVYQI